MKRLLHISWSNSLAPWNIFTPKTFLIEISSRRTSCCTKRTIWLVLKWLILDFPKISQHRILWVRWAALHITLPQRSSSKNTIVKLMYGPWELFFISCYLERYHSQEEQSLRSSRTSSRENSISITRPSKMFQRSAKILSRNAWSKISLRDIQLLRH